MTDAFAEVTVAGTRARGVVRPAHVAALTAGHFPGDPLVPGAHLLGLMVDLAATVVAGDGAAPTVARVVRCAFLAPVRPGAPLVVSARAADADGGAEAEVETDGVRAARARLEFRRA